MSKPVKHRDKWRVRWIDERGNRQSAVFDEYRRAQTELSRRQADVDDIRRGVRSAPPPPKTVSDLCDYWLEKRAPRKRSRKDDASLIRRHLRPYFGSMLVQAVRVEDGDDYLNAKIDDEDLSEKYVHNPISLLETMLRAASNFSPPWLTRVPKFNKPAVALFSTDYQWLRNDDEVRRFVAAARADGEGAFVLYTAAIFTGMRAGELASLEWSDVDLERRLITVQRSFDGPTKSGKLRHVPILDPLLPVLRAWRLRHPGQLVFTNEAGTMFKRSARIFQEVLHRVLEAAGFPKVLRGGDDYAGPGISGTPSRRTG